MTCPRCKSPMKEEKRSFHKNRKWICPKCGKVRFQPTKPRDSRDSKFPKGKGE